MIEFTARHHAEDQDAARGCRRFQMTRKSMRSLTLIVVLLGALPLSAQVDPGAKKTELPDPMVGAHYFYWYRYPTEHFRNVDGSDGLYQHFKKPRSVDYRSIAWHREQIELMMEASLDFFCPVYWGIPDRRVESTRFSDRGLTKIVEALSEIERDGGEPPKVAMFYDTSTLLHRTRGDDRPGTLDLRVDENIAIMRDTILNFYEKVPPRFRFQLGEFAVVVLYSSFSAPHDRDLFERLNAAVQTKIKQKLFFVAERSWSARAQARYAWGSALNGPNGDALVQTLGPGYNDTPVPGRGTPIRDREDGRFYRWSWNRVLLQNPTLVLLETWNEFHEGTGIAPSKEFGDDYIKTTRRYIHRLKRRMLPDVQRPVRLVHPDPLPRPDKGWWRQRRNTQTVTFSPAAAPGNLGDGLRLARNDDGPFKRGREGSYGVIRSINSGGGPSYLYVGVADEFAHKGLHSYALTVEYIDGGSARFRIQYDSWDHRAAVQGAYKNTPQISQSSLPGRKKARFILPDARFSNRQNAGADFRISVEGGDLSVLRLKLERLEKKVEGRPSAEVLGG